MGRERNASNWRRWRWCQRERGSMMVGVVGVPLTERASLWCRSGVPSDVAVGGGGGSQWSYAMRGRVHS